MTSLQAAFEPFVVALLRKEGSRRAHVTGISIFLLVVACVCAIGAIGFLSVAVYNYFLALYGQQRAIILMGSGFAFDALFCVLLAYTIQSYARSRAKTYYRTAADNIRALLEVLSHELEEPILNHPKTAAVVATLAGYVIGEKISDSGFTRH